MGGRRRRRELEGLLKSACLSAYDHMEMGVAERNCELRTRGLQVEANLPQEVIVRIQITLYRLHGFTPQFTWARSLSK